MADVALDGLRAGSAPRDLVRVLPALRGVIPGGGLRPGSVVGVEGEGAGSLGAALVAGVMSEDEGWSAIVGVPEFGVSAAIGMGASAERLLLVDDPGERWPDVVAALVEAVDLVLLRPPERPGSAAVRRISALARKHGCVMALAGPFAWPGTRLRLSVGESSWHGLADGHGRLQGRRARVTAEGNGPKRAAWVWLPAPDGRVALDEVSQRRTPLELVDEEIA
ncbi:hypothetical protein [Spirillospora sp. CA-294931]|uniref:hypothetical protein n=1 Tax=Spirillospora sp. CA-294931 TaxID=3240042 RepID=UPI003D8EEF74